MQFVRCGACGAKALPAASRCPRCAHPLNLREDSGALVPLMRCPSCDTYFPRVQGACRWCTPQPARSAMATPARMSLAVVLTCALGAGAWWYWSRGRAPAAPRATPVQADSVATPPVTAPSPAPVADTASLAARSGPGDSVAPAGATQAPAIAFRPVPLPASVAWVPATARTWVNVHVAPDKASPSVGVVERDAQVQLGDIQFGWRRVRDGPVTGWVDPALFTIEALRR